MHFFRINWSLNSARDQKKITYTTNFKLCKLTLSCHLIKKTKNTHMIYQQKKKKGRHVLCTQNKKKESK